MRLKDVASAVFCFNVESVLDFVFVNLDQLVFVFIRELTVVIGVELEWNLVFNFLVSVFSV